MPSLKALQTFELASAFPSFSSAASANYMTHGAISYQIRSLEEWLGIELFERVNGGVTLTEAGLELQTACGEAMSILESKCAHLKEQSSKLRVGCTTTLLGYFLLPLMEPLLRSYPDLKCTFNTHMSMEDLTLGKLDIIIASGISQPTETLYNELLFQEPIGPVCSSSNKYNTCENPQLLVADQILNASSRLSAWKEWGEAYGLKDFDPPHSNEFDSLSLAIDAAVANIGFIIAPYYIVKSRLDSGQLVAPFGFKNVDRGTYFFTEKEAIQRPEINAFITALKDSIA